MNGHKVSFKIYFSNNKQRGVIISSADTFTFDNSRIIFAGILLTSCLIL